MSSALSYWRLIGLTEHASLGTANKGCSSLSVRSRHKAPPGILVAKRTYRR